MGVHPFIYTCTDLKFKMLFEAFKVLLWDVELLLNSYCSEIPFNLPRCMMMIIIIITAVVWGSLK